MTLCAKFCNGTYVSKQVALCHYQRLPRAAHHTAGMGDRPRTGCRWSWAAICTQFAPLSQGTVQNITRDLKTLASGSNLREKNALHGASASLQTNKNLDWLAKNSSNESNCPWVQTRRLSAACCHFKTLSSLMPVKSSGMLQISGNLYFPNPSRSRVRNTFFSCFFHGSTRLWLTKNESRFMCLAAPWNWYQRNNRQLQPAQRWPERFASRLVWKPGQSRQQRMVAILELISWAFAVKKHYRRKAWPKFAHQEPCWFSMTFWAPRPK